MYTSSSSSSSDEEILDVVHHLERQRVFMERQDPFVKYSEDEFRQRYRLKKQTVHNLVQLLQDNLAPETARNHALAATDQILITLRFYATGSFQILVGDDHGIHKTTVCRIVTKVTNHIAALAPEVMFMPSTADAIAKTKIDFYAKAGFPNVIGCVDGTHIRINSPGGENSELFRNRKGYFSINVQAICDANLAIRNLDARWPGSTHDSTMFQASSICARFGAGEFPGSYLLGDSAYACTQYMMTSLLGPNTISEHNYNTAQIRTRNLIERCFGVWKRRFPCLAFGLRTKLDTTLAIIVATAVLHNIAVNEHDNEGFEAVELENINDQVNFDNNIGGDALRRSLINTVFQ